MKNFFKYNVITFIVIFLISFSINSAELNTIDKLTNIQISKNVASMPLTFTANQGQWDENLKFRANAGGATMWFATDGAYYQFIRTIKSEYEMGGSRTSPTSAWQPSSPALVGKVTLSPDIMNEHQSDSIETMMIKANFIGANLNPQMVGVDMVDYKCNYFIGNVKSKWATDVPNYSAVMYEQIYDGIDLKYYGNGRQMEYDFIVEPGADFSQIKIQYEGAESIAVNDNGELVVTTIWGQVVEQRPVIYQVENNRRVPIDGEYILQSEHSFSFGLSKNYDPTLPLVIDPVLEYSTYLGGSKSDYSGGITLDEFGNIYIVGYTNSANFPIKNEYQLYYSSNDVFVSKISSDGSSLIYSTFIGGVSDDLGQKIVLDDSNNAYITGKAGASDFPIVGNDRFYQGGGDVFVTKINTEGNKLIYSILIGGRYQDEAYDIALDKNKNIIITGKTRSLDFPVNTLFESYQGGYTDAFVSKLNSKGNELIFSTYLGGEEFDEARGVVVDKFDNIYITGTTMSDNFPITENSYQNWKGSSKNAFVVKLNKLGKKLIYSTFIGGGIGGGYSSNSYDIAVDDFECAYFTGSQDASASNEKGVYIKKLNTSGNELVYSKILLSGFFYGLSYGITVNRVGEAYATGWILQAMGKSETFLSKVNKLGNSKEFSILFGGSYHDYSQDIVLKEPRDIYITGWTGSADFPVKDEFSTYVGGYDAFIAKFREPACCIGIRGNVNGDAQDKMNISDLIYLIKYLFLNGSEPPCFEEGDVDGSGKIQIKDLVTLLKYMFTHRGTPAECPLK